MAYPTVNSPYGLKPINLIGGQVFAGSTREIAITTNSVNYNTAMFNGDVVQLSSSGTVIISTLAAQTSPVAGLTHRPTRRSSRSTGPDSRQVLPMLSHTSMMIQTPCTKL